MAFFDGQNLFAAAKDHFGHDWAMYDPRKLAEAVSAAKGWDLVGVRFYTGMPHADYAPKQNRFWTSKIAQMGRFEAGQVRIQSYTRPLRYRDEVITVKGGGTLTHTVAREKGIDVRIALDLIRCFLLKEYEAAIIFSQDQDLNEAVKELKYIAKMLKNRPLYLCSAYPEKVKEERGIDGCDWFPINETLYNQCLDPRNYGHLPNLRG